MSHKNKIITTSILALLVALSIKTPALASASFFANTNNIYVGDSFTVTVNLGNIAAWNVHVNASGPVTGCSIAQADASANAQNTSKVFTASCTATGAGTIQVNLSGDTTTENGDNEALSGSINVFVTEGETPPSPAPDSSPSQESSYVPSDDYVYQPTGYQSPQSSDSAPATDEEPPKSSNTDASISIDGYTLSEEKGVYKTTVPYNVSEISITASPKDEKTAITGDGIIQLEPGKNSITITATAEDGTTKLYNLEITREENANDIMTSTEQKDNNIAPIIIVLVILLILALGVIITLAFIIKKQKNRAKSKQDNPSPIDTTPPNTTNPYNPTSY